MTLFSKFINFIRENNLFQKSDHLLIAVSGGVDSIVLCALCQRAGFDFSMAHCNFQLRGEESERDEKFVRELALKYGVSLYVKKFETIKYSEKTKLSIQVAARELRYDWFHSIMGGENEPGQNDNTSSVVFTELPPNILLTAHHANDNIETLLMNFFKGTGIKGLQGIPAKNTNTVRPLLFAKKEELLVFAKDNDLSFVNDSSNISEKYTRNYFRNRLIPSLQKVFPQVEENLLNTIERNREIEILYNQSIFLHKQKLLEFKGNEIHIPVLKLLKAKPLKTILYEVIKEYGFTAHQADEVLMLIKSETGKYISSSSHRIFKNRNWLVIAPGNTLNADHILINERDKETDFGGGKLKFSIHTYEESSGKIPDEGNNKVAIDTSSIIFPLLLRKYKAGDYFYPLGMKHKKKLSKFFIDQKLSLTEKEKVWVLESNKKIIWVLGMRIDDRFKITPKTKNVLQLNLC